MLLRTTVVEVVAMAIKSLEHLSLGNMVGKRSVYGNGLRWCDEGFHRVLIVSSRLAVASSLCECTKRDAGSDDRTKCCKPVGCVLSLDKFGLVSEEHSDYGMRQ